MLGENDMHEEGPCPGCREWLKKTGKRLVKAVKAAVKQGDLELVERLHIALIFEVDEPESACAKAAQWN